jgi:hypothetical protein
MEKKQLCMSECGPEKRCLLAHDLNNDLHVILGRCDLLSESLQPDSEAVKHLRFIREAARHMAENVADRPCQVTRGRRHCGRN